LRCSSRMIRRSISSTTPLRSVFKPEPLSKFDIRLQMMLRR
jgi:hypothetical protein